MSDPEQPQEGPGPRDTSDPGVPSPRVAAAAIRDAIDALRDERPDLAKRLEELAAELER